MGEKTLDPQSPVTTQASEPESDVESAPQEALQADEGGDDGAASEPSASDGETDEAAEGNLERAVAALETALAQSKAEADKNRTDYLRTLADMDNLRKRTEREKDNARKFALEQFASDLLDVMDNVTRALDTLEAGVEGDTDPNSAVQSVIEGVQLIQAAFEKTLSKHGVVRIACLNESFDPNFHLAVQQVEAKDTKPGTVVQEMRAGYLLNERLLRPSMVAVSQ